MLFVAGFLLCAVIIFFAGKKLSRYGDMLSYNGLNYQVKGKRFWLAWDAAIIFIVYIISLILLYRFTL
jgi:uncharacterized membrane protein (DUF485 family)